MKCERCQRNKEAERRVFTEIIDMKVCADCGEEARRLRMAVEVLETEGGKNERAESKLQGYRVELLGDFRQ